MKLLQPKLVITCPRKPTEKEQTTCLIFKASSSNRDKCQRNRPREALMLFVGAIDGFKIVQKENRQQGY